MSGSRNADKQSMAINQKDKPAMAEVTINEAHFTFTANTDDELAKTLNTLLKQYGRLADVSIYRGAYDFSGDERYIVSGKATAKYATSVEEHLQKISDAVRNMQGGNQ